MLKKSFALLFTLSCFIQAGPPKPEDITKIEAALPNAPAKAKKPRKVLLFSKTAGFRHGSIETAVVALTKLGEKTGAYSADHTEDPSYFEKDKLSQYDAVIFVNTTGEVFKGDKEVEERLKKNLVDFVTAGGGLAGIHSATDTYKNWKEYNDMMGGAFDGHPWHMPVPIKNLAPKNAINLDLEGADFLVTDEIYQFRKDTAKASDRKMLLALDNSKPDITGKGKYGPEALYPISWIDTYGKGRIYYCSLGHREEIYWNATVLKHYIRGIQYVLGDLDADAAPGK
ncbi:MAG: type 1 glutamine amidotransferase [Kiritimatiellia bacterium]|jgi:uncharacterized protein